MVGPLRAWSAMAGRPVSLQAADLAWVDLWVGGGWMSGLVEWVGGVVGTSVDGRICTL